jgi:hypothetical protein
VVQSKLTRRQLLFLVGAAPLTATDGNFWNTKPSSQWDVGEIYLLLNQSPWANQAVWMPQLDTNNYAIPQITEAPRGGRTTPPRPPPSPSFKTVVTWDSALPIREALKTDADPIYVNHYVIGVDGFPPGDVSRQLLRFASLRSTGYPKWTVHASNMRHRLRVSSVWLFAFSRAAAPIVASTDSVTFELSFRDWMLATSFKPKSMLYRGGLAL